MITPSPKSKKEGQFIVEMLKSALHIKSKEGYLSGRAEMARTLPASFETEDIVNIKNLIADENKYVFDSKVYDVNEGRFFLQIEYPDEKPVIKSLRTKEDTLLLFAADFAGTQTSLLKAKFKLGYYSKKNNTSVSLIEIKPYVDASGEMERIMKVMIDELKEGDKQKLKHLCYAEIYEALGKPSDILFNLIFNKLMTERNAKNSQV